MMPRLENGHDSVVGYSLSGEVSADEYTQVASGPRDEIAEHGVVRGLVRWSDLKVSSLFTALAERSRVVRDHHEEAERVAIVTDDTAMQMLSTAASAAPVEIRTYSSDDESKAWAWLE
jgi:hypothetical protein